MDRRQFVKTSAVALTGLGLSTTGASLHAMTTSAPLYKISLAQWSLHQNLFNGEMENLDFASTAKEEFGIGAVEYVNQFFMDKATNTAYLQKMKRRAKEAGVNSLLIMCDQEGALGHPDAAKRKQAVENHHKWVDAAKFLGCHSIRVNAHTREEGSYKEQMQRMAEGLRSLTEFAAERDISVIVENHGGISSNGEWLAGVMEQVDHDHCGTLPDFGNFCLEWSGDPYESACSNEYDRYKGVKELMPYAKGVSAKTYAFNNEGNETTIDYPRIMRIVLDAGYRGHVGIEYEGDELSEFEGIRMSKKLLMRTREQLRSEYE